MTVKRLDDSTLVGIVTLTGASHLDEPDLIEIKRWQWSSCWLQPDDTKTTTLDFSSRT